MVMRRMAGAVGLLGLVGVGVALAAAPQTTFRTGNRTVAVYATVTDLQGRLVPDLVRDDFEVEDDNRRQTLTVFANDIQPITIVVLLDSSWSMEGNFDLVRRSAEAFVKELGPADQARIGTFSKQIRIEPPDFTADPQQLITVLQTSLQERGPTPLWNAVNLGITALLPQQGRRVILVFTDGTDFPFNFNTRNSSLAEVIKRADEENVMVYAIGLAGQRVPTRVGVAPGTPRGTGTSRLPTAAPTPPIMPVGKPDPGLPAIAAATGGGYFELTSASDLAATFRRVAEELHHQYVLGFTPETLDGRSHRVTVRVRGATMSARARKTYLATPP